MISFKLLPVFVFFYNVVYSDMTIELAPDVIRLPSIHEDITIICEVGNSNAYSQPVWLGPTGAEILAIGQGNLANLIYMFYLAKYFFLYKFKRLLHHNLKLACFVCYLKIINCVLKKNMHAI